MTGRQNAVVGETRVIRMQQQHKGIPVYGADLRATVENGKLTRVFGKPVNDIDIDTTPVLSYPQVIARYNASSETAVVAKDKGQLVIYRETQDDLVAWRGLVEIDGIAEIHLYSAADASLLFREKLVNRDQTARVPL